MTTKKASHTEARSALNQLQFDRTKVFEPAQLDQYRSTLTQGVFSEPVIVAEDGRVLFGAERLNAYRSYLGEKGLNDGQIDVTEVPIVRVSGIDAQGETALSAAASRLGNGNLDAVRIGSILDQLSGADIDTKFGSHADQERATSPVNRVEGRHAPADKPTAEGPLQHAVGGGRLGHPNRATEGEESAAQAVDEQQRRVRGTGANSPSTPGDAAMLETPPITAPENTVRTAASKAATDGKESGTRVKVEKDEKPAKKR